MTDTHDTNLPEKPAELEEEKKAAEVSETATTETQSEEQAPETAPAAQKLTKEEIIARLKAIAADTESVTKAEIDSLKQSFYKQHNAEQEAARKKFEEFLADIEFKSPRIPVFTNVTGDAVFDPNEIKKNLVKQVVSTVRWEDCVRNAAKLGIEQFYECGPGGVLAGMVRRIDKTLPVKSLAEYPDFQ